MTALTLLPLLLLAPTSRPLHDGPDPIGSWRLRSAEVRDGELHSMLGVAGRLDGAPAWVGAGDSEALFFDGSSTRVVLAPDHAGSKQKLPRRHMTVEAWVSVNSAQPWGGLLGVLQDNGGAERGWILGYDQERFTFGLSTEGADDGDGVMTYLRGKRAYSEGGFHHVVATYDGEVQRLYVDGELDAEGRTQSGDVLYPEHAPLVLGGYLDADESYFHHGRIHSVRLFEQSASADWVRGAFAHHVELGRAEPYIWVDPEHRFVVRPYLQWPTSAGMTVRWETSRPASTTVEYADAVRWEGEGDARVGFLDRQVVVEGARRLHEARIEGLAADAACYYRVRSVDSLGRELASPILSFQTAPEPGTPIAFAVISDTQGNPEVSGRIAEHAWALRPRFVLHPGDLVSTGSVKREWVEEFFASMRPLLERAPLLPVLGNHEQDARFYYDYMSLPAPEYFYTARYGDLQLFMLDSNREVGPGSEQHAWLARELAASEALWKLVCYHHPAYSSDENDYGDTWSGPSTRGDERVRALTPLYDKHGVDLVWNGHIHSYERTWPLRAGAPTEPGNGTVYMITGGGGGSLETPGPIRPPFQNNVRRGHHFCFVAVNGRTLELRSYDLEGRLFDTLTIQK